MKSAMRKFAIAFFILLSLSLTVGNAAAQGDGPSDNEVNAIAKNLYCPVCENVPLDSCPTLACQQWRDQIADKLTLGWSDEQIYDYFVEQYGDRVLAAPPLRGLNWLVYLLPPTAILIAAVLLYRNLRKWRKVQAETTETSAGQKGDYIQQLEDELKARR